MLVSAVICTRNRADLIGLAAQSVLANTYHNFELIIVDQSENDLTRAVVDQLLTKYSNLRYIFTSTPGLGRARNIGVHAARGDIVAFTDDDCTAYPDWINAVADVFLAEPTVDMLFGQVLVPDKLSAEGVGHLVPSLPISEPHRLSRRDGFRIFGMGADMAIRRRLFDRVGEFDELLGAGGPLQAGEDFDFEYRVFLAGGTILGCSGPRVDHYGMRTEAEWPGTLRGYGMGDGAFYFKHVRCGDTRAFRMFAWYLTRLWVRELLHATGVRRRWSRATYLLSCFRGIRESMRYSVDRQRRVYVPRAA